MEMLWIVGAISAVMAVTLMAYAVRWRIADAIYAFRYRNDPPVAGEPASEILRRRGAGRPTIIFAISLEKAVADVFKVTAFDPATLNRIARAACSATTVPSEDAFVELAFPVADASGKRRGVFRTTISWFDVAMKVIAHARLDVFDVLRWWKSDDDAMALGHWLLAELTARSGKSVTLEPPAVFRIATTVRLAAGMVRTFGTMTVHVPSEDIDPTGVAEGFEQTIDLSTLYAAKQRFPQPA